MKESTLWNFPGGIHLPQHKTQSTQLPLGELPIPPQLIIPLQQQAGTPAYAIVKPGDRVLAGQLIALAGDAFSANVHASSSGTVTTISSHVLPHPDGMSGDCITIATDGRHDLADFIPCPDFYAEEPSALLEKIRSTGVIGLGGAGFPTATKLSGASGQKIDTLIINGAECEPFITADDVLMQTRPEEVIQGTLLLAHILNSPARVIIAVEDNKPQAIAALRDAVAKLAKNGHSAATNIELASLPTKYPSGGAKQLIQALTGRETPSGHHSAAVGAVCVNAGTTAAAWRAVRYGEPLIRRVMTVTGAALEMQRNIDVLIGTPISYVLEHHGFDRANALHIESTPQTKSKVQAKSATRVIAGGSMMGFTLHDVHAPVIKTSHCLIATTAQELPLPAPEQTCIRCGLCADVCPASLLPQQLFWHARSGNHEQLHNHNLFDCIECGACAYVCPSNIPLVQSYRAAKNTIREQVAEREKADRSRQRFEFRQQRFAHAEAEKDNKRNARKLAAEEARQILAEQKNNAADIDEKTATPTVQVAKPAATKIETVMAAVEQANKIELGYDEQKLKLERMVNAAKNSLASACAPLVPRNIEIPITEEQLIKQQARIKQAELKVKETEKKLADFMAGDKANQATEKSDLGIARIQEKLASSPVEKLRSNIDALQSRLRKTEEKANEAKTSGAPNADALQRSVDTFRQKLRDAENELRLQDESDDSKNADAAEQNAAIIAIARAKEKATQQANMSDAEKREQQIKLLELRLEKSRERLQIAEAENNPNIEAFRSGVLKLEEKLKEFY